MQSLIDSFYSCNRKSFIGFRCAYCEEIITEENFSVDHVIPKNEKIDFGGNSNNTVVCCKKCNNLKASKSLLFFLGLIDMDTFTKFDSKYGTMPEKEKTLNNICGLKVTSRKSPDNKEVEFTFYIGNQAVKSCYTYPKAKIFAEGFALGRSCK